MRCGVAGFSSTFLGGGGGGGAAEGTEPIMPPRTPPGVPPATPPGTPPTTPATPEDGGGSSSSLICAMSLGMTLGTVSLPASNCRGMILTGFTIAAGAGGGGGGGGGGGATSMLCNWAVGSTSKYHIGTITATPISSNCARVDTTTVDTVLVFPVCTNVCSNISVPFPIDTGKHKKAPAALNPLLRCPGRPPLVRLRRSLARRIHPGSGGGRRLLVLIRVIVPEQHDRAGNEHRRIRAYDNSTNQGEREAMQHRTAEQEQGDHGEERQARRHDGSAQRLVDGAIHHLLQGLAPRDLEIFADPIEDHDRVVHRITDQGQQGRDHRHRNLLVEDREQS